METENSLSRKANNKPLHFLLVGGEFPGLHTKNSVTREAQEVLALSVPGYTVCVGLLVHDFLFLQIVHLTDAMFVHNGKFGSVFAQI